MSPSLQERAVDWLAANGLYERTADLTTATYLANLIWRRQHAVYEAILRRLGEGGHAEAASFLRDAGAFWGDRESGPEQRRRAVRARVLRQTPERRSEIARLAARARWDRRPPRG